jgi:hypothetical protein
MRTVSRNSLGASEGRFREICSDKIRRNIGNNIYQFIKSFGLNIQARYV